MEFQFILEFFIVNHIEVEKCSRTVILLSIIQRWTWTLRKWNFTSPWNFHLTTYKLLGHLLDHHYCFKYKLPTWLVLHSRCPVFLFINGCAYNMNCLLNAWIDFVLNSSASQTGCNCRNCHPLGVNQRSTRMVSCLRVSKESLHVNGLLLFETLHWVIWSYHLYMCMDGNIVSNFSVVNLISNHWTLGVHILCNKGSIIQEP